MSDLPPYGNSDSYIPPTQYPPSGYPIPDYVPANPSPAPGYMPTNAAPMPGYMPNPAPTPVYMVQPQYMAVPVNDPGSGQALAGMILGIAGLFFSFFGLVPLLGLIFSIIGMRSVTRKGMAIAGLILSIIGLLLAVFVTLLIIGLIAAAMTAPTIPPPTY